MTELKTVIDDNRALLARMKALNLRTGLETFPIPSREELRARMTNVLQGARRVAEIRDLEVLRLPLLDEVQVAEVLRLCPDTIEVLGREVAVEYRQPYYSTPRPPLVRIDFKGDDAKRWVGLPDEGICLPDGREVVLYSVIEGYGYYIEAESSKFKEKACECLNQAQWDNWQKPELPAPTDSIPPIAEKEYGLCAVTDVVLVAYGTVNYDSWYGSWKSCWSRDRDEADKVHAQACAKFVEVREKADRVSLRKRVGELRKTHYDALSEDLRERLYNTQYGYSGGASTVAEIEALIAEVEAIVEQAALEAKAKAEAEEQARRAALALGRKRIEHLNERRKKLGWAEFKLFEDSLSLDCFEASYEEEEALQEAETEVATEEKRQVDLANRKISSADLAALAAHFNKK